MKNITKGEIIKSPNNKDNQISISDIAFETLEWFIETAMKVNESGKKDHKSCFFGLICCNISNVQIAWFAMIRMMEWLYLAIISMGEVRLSFNIEDEIGIQKK